MATKKELEQKRELARMYYMQGETQKSIASKTGVSEQTIGKWVQQEGWETKRAAQSVTRPELVTKNLLLINRLLDKVNESDDPLSEAGAVADKISKLAAAIEHIDKKTNIVDTIEVFIAFGRWMDFRFNSSNEDDFIMAEFISKIKEAIQKNENVQPKIKREFLKTLNRYQDMYISDSMAKK